MILNLYKYTIPGKDEDFTTLFMNEKVEIVRIVSGRVETPKHFKDETDEWVVLLKGEAKLKMEGRLYHLQPGDNLFIPAYMPHTLVEVVPGSLWLAIHIKECNGI
ncbi:cupin domain-containing protein [Nitratiruptor sp. YY09-18]|uniref:cupin domain-containing protein n=1 Tax=Nitratiruptor sp. YY09-18 TaxID=2724901 RepID=UPI001936329A|nr:cupin domain-containing protein [Nitratiruptor sp. YY09-18]BCD68723.1 cupin 2 domain-containing protein [Nitratiruptor sp. YY09-18]